MSIKTLYEKDGTTPMVSGLNAGIPDYAVMSTKDWNVEHKADENGYVMIGVTTNKDQPTTKLTIDNSTVDAFYFYVQTESNSDIRMMYPVMKGQKYKATGGGVRKIFSSSLANKVKPTQPHGLRPCVHLCEQGVLT